MKLIKSSRGKARETKDVPGLLSCQIDYNVADAAGILEYSGPKLDPAVWHQVMSFFRWTHQEMRSESQVRLYVNCQLGRWATWAFPQAARTGMTAQELGTPETVEQARERFATWDSEPSDSWLYFGSAHHHCSLNAFQSSTDEQNECDQDGLHITVGNMDADRHDVHARFYLGGNCFEPDLSLFWPVEENLAGKIPHSLLAEVARFEMGEKIESDFPAVWRANVMEVKTKAPTRDPFDPWEGGFLEYGLPESARVEFALEEISQRCAEASGGIDWRTVLQHLAACETSQIIVASCLRHGVMPEEVLREIREFSEAY